MCFAKNVPPKRLLFRFIAYIFCSKARNFFNKYYPFKIGFILTVRAGCLAIQSGNPTIHAGRRRIRGEQWYV